MEFAHKHLSLFLKLLLALAVFLLLTRSAQFKPDLLIKFFSHPFFLTAVITIFIFQIFLGSWRWYLLNSAQQINLDFFSTFIATYIGSAFNNILPGAIGGDFVRWFYLARKIPDKKNGVLFSLFLDRILGFIGVFIAVASVFSTRMQALSQNPELDYSLLLFSLFSIAMLAGFYILIAISGKIQPGDYFQKRFPNQKWAKFAGSFFNALSTCHISKSAIAKCLLISVFIQFIMAITVKLIAEMMGFTGISLSDYLIAASLTQIVNLIPATPGGVGIGEIAFANILYLLNPGTNAAYATVYFAFRLIGTLTYLPGVILTILRVLASRRSRAMV
jgi:uncharacterized protein (TIRG00374 family)